MITKAQVARIKRLLKFYSAIERLVGPVEKFLDGYHHLKLESSGFMPLCIEHVGSNQISLAHYYEQNGDLMRDPDVVMEIDLANKGAFPLTYQQDGLGLYQEIYIYDKTGKKTQFRPRLQKSIESFMVTWFENIEAQRFPSFEERELACILTSSKSSMQGEVYVVSASTPLQQETSESVPIQMNLGII